MSPLPCPETARMTQSARFCQNHLARPSSLLPLSTVYRWLRSTTSLNALLLNRHTCNRFEQASLIVECHSDCALDNSFFRVIHADPSAHPRRNGRLRVDMKPLPLGRCSRRVHSVRLRRLKDLANAFGHASEAQRRRFALPGPLFPKWQLPACPETAMSGMGCCERRPLAPLLNTHAWNRVW